MKKPTLYLCIAGLMAIISCGKTEVTPEVKIVLNNDDLHGIRSPIELIYLKEIPLPLDSSDYFEERFWGFSKDNSGDFYLLKRREPKRRVSGSDTMKTIQSVIQFDSNGVVKHTATLSAYTQSASYKGTEYRFGKSLPDGKPILYEISDIDNSHQNFFQRFFSEAPLGSEVFTGKVVNLEDSFKTTTLYKPIKMPYSSYIVYVTPESFTVYNSYFSRPITVFQKPHLFRRYDRKGSILKKFGIVQKSKDQLNLSVQNYQLLTADNYGNIYIQSPYENRIDKHSPNGALIMQINNPVSYKSLLPDTTVMYTMLQYYPISLDEKGRIWIRSYLRVPYKKGDASKTSNEFHIFNPDGTFLCRIRLQAEQMWFLSKIFGDKLYVPNRTHGTLFLSEYAIVEKGGK